MSKFINALLPATLLALLFTAASPTSAQSDDATAQAIASFQKGQDAHEKGDLAAAIELYTKALNWVPEFPEAELQRGNAYMSLGRDVEAERSFRKAIELRKDWSLPMASLGSLLVTHKKFDEAYGLLKRTLELDAMNPLALSATAELLIETGSNSETLRQHLGRMREFAGKVRPPVAVLTSKAALEATLGERAAAIESASRALQIDPNSRAALSLLANLALLENDVEKADAYVVKLESLFPKSLETITLRARSLFARGKKAQALTSLEAIQNPSEAVKAMIAQIKDGDVADLTGLEAKVQRTPDDPNVLTKLCVGFRVSSPGKALEYCRRASVLEPNEMSHAVNFGAALVQSKRYEEAIGLFRKLLTLQPEHATIRANLATALYQLKLLPEAKAEFQWLTEKQPESPAAYYFLAVIHDQLGEYLDAMANYQQYLKLADPESSKIDIDKVNLRLPALRKQIKDGKGKKTR